MAHSEVVEADSPKAEEELLNTMEPENMDTELSLKGKVLNSKPLKETKPLSHMALTLKWVDLTSNHPSALITQMLSTHHQFFRI